MVKIPSNHRIAIVDYPCSGMWMVSPSSPQLMKTPRSARKNESLSSSRRMVSYGFTNSGAIEHMMQSTNSSQMKETPVSTRLDSLHNNTQAILRLRSSTKVNSRRLAQAVQDHCSSRTIVTSNDPKIVASASTTSTSEIDSIAQCMSCITISDKNAKTSKELTCDSCNQTFPSVKKFEDHIPVSTREKPHLVCKYCKHHFAMPGPLTAFKMKGNEHMFTCKKCRHESAKKKVNVVKAMKKVNKLIKDHKKQCLTTCKECVKNYRKKTDMFRSNSYQKEMQNLFGDE